MLDRAWQFTGIKSYKSPQNQKSLTPRAPDPAGGAELGHVHHRRDDDGRQRRLRYVLERVGQEANGQQHQQPGDDAAERRPHAARVVDGGARERAGDGHRAHERAGDVAAAQSDQLLRGVDRLAVRCAWGGNGERYRVGRSKCGPFLYLFFLNTNKAFLVVCWLFVTDYKKINV